MEGISYGYRGRLQSCYIRFPELVTRAFRPVSRIPSNLGARTGGMGKVCMCHAYGTWILRGGFNAGLKGPPLPPAHSGTHWHRSFPDVHTSQQAVNLVVAVGRERVRIEMELKMIFNFIFGRHKKDHNRKAGALADLHVGESAILSELQLSPPVAEHLMNLGFVPGLEVTVARSGPGGDPRVYRVEGTEIAMRRDVSRHIHVELLGAPAFGD